MIFDENMNFDNFWHFYLGPSNNETWHIFGPQKAQNGTKNEAILRAEGLKVISSGQNSLLKNIKNTSKPKVRQKVEIPIYGEATFRKGVFMKRVRRPLIRGRRTCIDNLKMTKNWTQNHGRSVILGYIRWIQNTRCRAPNWPQTLHTKFTIWARRAQNRPFSSKIGFAKIDHPKSKICHFTTQLRWISTNLHDSARLALPKPFISTPWLRQMTWNTRDWLCQPSSFCPLASPNFDQVAWIVHYRLLPKSRHLDEPSFAEFRPTDHRTLDFDVLSRKSCAWNRAPFDANCVRFVWVWRSAWESSRCMWSVLAKFRNRWGGIWTDWGKISELLFSTKDLRKIIKSSKPHQNLRFWVRFFDLRISVRQTGRFLEVLSRAISEIATLSSQNLRFWLKNLKIFDF